MSINLKKGQKIDLTKTNPGLDQVMVGLGWNPAEQKGGFLGGLFGSKTHSIDCDASVFMLNGDGLLEKDSDLIYFGNKRSACKSVIHNGDNLTGSGDGDDEQIIIELSKVPDRIHRILFTVNIYDCVKRNQDFGMIKNAFIRIIDKGGKELIRYDLSEDYVGKTALIVGQIYRHNGEWKFSAMGEGTIDRGLSDIVQKLRNKETAYGV